MEKSAKRRSSILKPQQGAQFGGHEAGELSTTSNFIRRRVSFHNMRTVQEFDRERNDITRSPQKEPIKLGDTGSSDGLHSTRISTTSHVNEIYGAENDRPEEEVEKLEVRFNKTVENFFPLSASTPMPRGGLNDDVSRNDTRALFAVDSTFGPYGENFQTEEPKSEAHMDSDATFRYFHSSANAPHGTFAESNATHALFGPAHSGYSSTVGCNASELDEEDLTCQFFGAVAHEEVNANVMDTGVSTQSSGENSDLTIDLFKMSIKDASGRIIDRAVSKTPEKGIPEMTSVAAVVSSELEAIVPRETKNTSAAIFDEPAAAASPEEQELATTSAMDVEREATFASGDVTKRSENTLLRSADSPLAVVRKKSRMESPFRRDTTMPSRFNRSNMDSPGTLQHSIMRTPLRDSFQVDGGMDQTEATFTLSPALQAIARTKRFIRQSLDQSNLFSSPMVMLQDIMRPKRLSISSASDQVSELLMESTNQSPSRMVSMFRSFNNERIPEPSYVSSFDDSSEPVTNLKNESCALTCRFDSIDFDIKIGEVPCFHRDLNDHPVVARLRDVARQNLCRGIAALNAEREREVQEDLDRLMGHNSRLANALRMLNPKKLPRNEARAFEACRLKAQVVWYDLRSEVAVQALVKTSELINQRGEAYQKRLQDLALLKQYRTVVVSEKEDVQRKMDRLRNIEQLAMTGFEKNKVELASVREAIANKEIEVIELKTEIVKRDTERIRKVMEERVLRKKREQELAAIVSSLRGKVAAAKQAYAEDMARIGDF